MFKKYLIFGALVTTLQITTTAYSINHKLLDLESDSCLSKIWAGIPVSKNQIKDSLNFLHDNEAIEEKYSETSNFKKFYEKLKGQTKDQNLLQFAEYCQDLQKEIVDKTKKIALHLLLEKVNEKYINYQTKAEKLKSFEKPKGSINNNFIDIFLNADKNIELKTDE